MLRADLLNRIFEQVFATSEQLRSQLSNEFQGKAFTHSLGVQEQASC